MHGIEELRAAVAADPADRGARVALAAALRKDGRPEEALTELAAALAEAPDDADALAEAALAAEAVGDDEKAARYRRLADALAGPSRVAASGVVRLHAVRGDRDGEDVERPSLRLDDVAGLDHVKRRLRTSFLAPLENPALRRMYGKSLRGGLLLWGPPGCGKTFLARATAGELGARFIPIGLEDVLDMWLGESERNLHELFVKARENAPCVLFFDEIDALGRKRSHLRHSAGLREVVVQFLSELDGVDRDNEGVFVLAASNHPWDVDSALRRPGRLDRTLLVLPPDRAARVTILELHLRDRPVGDVDLEAIADKTDLFSGADLAHVCETAAEFALEDSLESGTARPIDAGDLERAVAEIEPSTVPWLQTARNYAEFGGERGTYEDLLTYVREKGLA